MKLLNIIASPRGEKSRSIAVSALFLSTLKGKYPDLIVEDLDLFKMKLPEVYGGAIDAKYAFMAGGAPNEASMNSWNEVAALSSEFAAADIYLISSPMWNFSVPYRLKQYIDIIMQAGILFRFTASGVEGLAKNKKMFVVSSRGNDYGKGTYMNQFDFQEPYLRSIFGLGGITDVTFLNIQPLDISPELAEISMEKAREDAKSMALNCELS